MMRSSVLLLLVLVFSPSWIKDGLARGTPSQSPLPSSELPSPSDQSPEEPQFPFEPLSPWYSDEPLPPSEVPENPYEPPSPSEAPRKPPSSSRGPGSPPTPPLPPKQPGHQLPLQPPSHQVHQHFTSWPQCLSTIIHGCGNEIFMVFSGHQNDLGASCCQTINNTPDDCLFKTVFLQTHDRFFMRWLREHCSPRCGFSH